MVAYIFRIGCDDLPGRTDNGVSNQIIGSKINPAEAHWHQSADNWQALATLR